MSGKKIIYKCENCVNLIQVKKNNLYDCDYGYFKNVKKQDMKLYVPMIFDCFEYEYIGKI